MTDPISKNPVAHFCRPDSPPRVLATDYAELKYFAAELRDKTDLFNFVCAMVSVGPIARWLAAYPVESLPHGGRAPESPEEAEQFMCHTRAEAIAAGLWQKL